jgi:hypothetical protein
MAMDIGSLVGGPLLDVYLDQGLGTRDSEKHGETLAIFLGALPFIQNMKKKKGNMIWTIDIYMY